MHYSAVNTKLSAIYAKYLKGDPQIKLLQEKSIQDILPLVETWWGIDCGGRYNLYEINRSLEVKIYEIQRSLSYYLQGESKKFYENLMARYEILDIKRSLRVLVHNEDIKEMKKSLLALSPSFLESSSGKMTVDKFLQKLEITEYGRQLITYRDQPMDRILFYVEMTLDRAYYENIMKQSLKLTKKDQEICRQGVGHHIDLLNLMYIYRGKKSYKILPQEMINFLIEGGQSLSLGKLRDLAMEESVGDFLRSVQKTKFSYLLPNKRQVGLIDIKIEQDIHERIMKIFQESRMDIGKVLGLTILLEHCVRDISAILEAKRLGFSLDRTRSLLSVKQKEGVN